MKKLILILFCIQSCYSQSSIQDEDLRVNVYERIIEDLSISKSDSNVYYNISTLIKMPKKLSKSGPLPSKIIESKILKDTLIINKIKKQNKVKGLKVFDFDEYEDINKIEPLQLNRTIVNIHNPIDFWKDYFFKFNNDLAYNDVYIPVEVIKVFNTSIDKKLLVYKIDI